MLGRSFSCARSCCGSSSHSPAGTSILRGLVWAACPGLIPVQSPVLLRSRACSPNSIRDRPCRTSVFLGAKMLCCMLLASSGMRRSNLLCRLHCARCLRPAESVYPCTCRLWSPCWCGRIAGTSCPVPQMRDPILQVCMRSATDLSPRMLGHQPALGPLTVRECSVWCCRATELEFLNADAMHHP